jgi:hypothetical protein
MMARGNSASTGTVMVAYSTWNYTLFTAEFLFFIKFVHPTPQCGIVSRAG